MASDIIWYQDRVPLEMVPMASDIIWNQDVVGTWTLTSVNTTCFHRSSVLRVEEEGQKEGEGQEGQEEG